MQKQTLSSAHSPGCPLCLRLPAEHIKVGHTVWKAKGMDDGNVGGLSDGECNGGDDDDDDDTSSSSSPCSIVSRLTVHQKLNLRVRTFNSTRVRPCTAVFTRAWTGLMPSYDGPADDGLTGWPGRCRVPCDGTRHPCTHGAGWQPY